MTVQARGARRSWRLSGALLAAALVMGLPEASAGQATEAMVAERQLELRAARSAYDAALGAYNVVERQWSAALGEVNTARRSGDTGRLERAHALAQDRSVPRRDQEKRLDEAGAALVRARQALIDILVARLEQLVREMDAASGAAQRAQLNAIFTGHQAELQALEAEAEETFRLQPVVLPEITFDPRDGRDELLAKAEILERSAAVADTTIRDQERQIQSLNERLRTQRQRRDFLAGAERFDDTRVPVVTGAPTGDRTAARDSTVAGARPLSLEERIQLKRDYVGQLQAYRDELLIRAQQFRRAVGSVT
ncbi:MAG TPA: hypothetical protein VLH75_05290 [Longimicrobiales bacterium]|nr:hypothetical protein [Longimicrobiales bacterium]